MKKLIALLLAAVMLLCAAAALAAEPVDLSTYTDAELDALRVQVAEEIAARRRAATASPAADFRYASDGSVVRIISYIGEGGEVVIPDVIDGLPVTQVYENAFKGNRSIAAVHLPDALVSIGENAFADSSITSVYLPEGLEMIEAMAFNRTYMLTQVLVLPESLKEIGVFAFQWCYTGGVVLQSDCKLIGRTLDNSKLRFCYIRPGCAVQIGSYTFANSSIETMVIPAEVTSIHATAFEGCNAVTVYCPAGSYAEQYCRENFIVCNTAEYEAMVAYYEALYPAQ